MCVRGGRLEPDDDIEFFPFESLIFPPSLLRMQLSTEPPSSEGAMDAPKALQSISIPLFSRRYVTFLTAFQIEPFHSSDPIFILGRTYGTYLHYERSYAINVFFIQSFGELGLRFDLPAKASVFSR